MNELSFAVRSRIRWQRGAPPAEQPSAAPWDDAFDWLPAAERAPLRARVEWLDAEHDLAAVRPLPVVARLENAALLDGLLRLAGDLALPVADAELRATDVGCGAFQYAPGLARWLTHLGERAAVRLRGIEIDGYGVYRDGHSRADHARAHADFAGPGVTFEVADFARLSPDALPPQDVVTMLYPFLSAFSLLQWGSPLSHLRPRAVLDRAVAAVRPGGLLVVANQTEREFERLAALLRDAPVTRLRRASFATDLVPYRERTAGRIASIWRRHASARCPTASS